MYGAIAPIDLKVETFCLPRPVFSVSPQATREKQEKRVFARTPRAPARGLPPLATPLKRLLNGPVSLELKVICFVHFTCLRRSEQVLEEDFAKLAIL